MMSKGKHRPHSPLLAQLFSVVASERTRDKEYQLEHRRFKLN